MEKMKTINIGIGFVTGRKNFKTVLRSYLNSLKEYPLPNRKKYKFHLFIAYDLAYCSTEVHDYMITEKDLLSTVDSVIYIDGPAIADAVAELTTKKAATIGELKLIFGEGYAMKRNAVLYFALKNDMDSLIFLDDDEYPIANLRAGGLLTWKGQSVLATHVENIQLADMTHGYHCGYISPIPAIAFNEEFSESDFHLFIEAISNDIISWDSIKEKMADGGITYASPDVIRRKKVQMVREVGGMKFISGANLGFNLDGPAKLFPFYNPPGARGEDTFLSTCIAECRVRKVPCYTFHDGFLAYPQLLSGTLPNQLQNIDISAPSNYRRFLKAAIGWIRYKPLLLLITHGEDYEARMSQIKEDLTSVMPKLCAYFQNEDFLVLLKELEFYDAHVYEHLRDFEHTKEIWLNIVSSLTK